MPAKTRIRTDLLQSRYTVRLDQATFDWVSKQAKEGGYRSGQDYIRELVKRERSGTTDAFRGLEERIAATLVSQTTEIDRMQRTSFANFAAVMNLANLILQTLLPPTREAKQVLDGNYKQRLDKFLQEMGIEMKGRWANVHQDLTASLGVDTDED